MGMGRADDGMQHGNGDGSGGGEGKARCLYRRIAPRG